MKQLCAAGTLGIAATGLALGVQAGNENAYPVTLGKRKWPGASLSKSMLTTQSALPPRRVFSQPIPSSIPTVQDQPENNARSALVFRRQSKRETRPNTASDDDAVGSRGSSTNRSSMFRPRTADTRSTSQHRDPSASSSWLKRLSNVSSTRTSSPSAPSSKLDSTPQSISSPIPENISQTLPNKLVKRSTSQRALSHDHARGMFLKRPATSHQRSATVQEWIPQETSFSTPATPYLSSESGPIWRPFFERGYSRKRFNTADQKDGPNLRTVSLPSNRQPVLMLGSELEIGGFPDSEPEKVYVSPAETRAISSSRQRLRRSLSSVHRAARRRHVTDPTVKLSTEAVNGTITSTIRQSPYATTLQSSPLDPNLPHRTPSFNSSPPLFPVRHRFSFRNRQSIAPSDPTTTSSDNDVRVFTDDDSMDFQSDTAYDSLTTRATASSHSALRTPKLETIFNEPQVLHDADERDTTLAHLVQRTTLTDDTTSHNHSSQSDQLRGIGITEIEEENDEMSFIEEPTSILTPVKSVSDVHDEYNATPIPHRLQYFDSPLRSSPPVPAPTAVTRDIGTPEFVIRPRQIEIEEEDIDWSPKSDKEEKASTCTLRPGLASNGHNELTAFNMSRKHSTSDLTVEDDNESDKRLSSIFDWSEHQKLGGETFSGIQMRPKTVHGKQGHDGSRSRSSGRKGPSQMHLRSQSVPNNRESNAEPAPLSTSKFGTWGLGHKGVSEEWSDDFDFDDIEDDEPPQLQSGPLKPTERGTIRGVKVPQAIIDRQASVHLQFGQVQEFMLLVEELKGLRARGAALQLLESHSKQLWEDAESIIDLATINNEDDVYVRPPSPTSSDIFGEEVAALPKNGHDKTPMDDQKKSVIALRSVSSPATPPHGRPRGESLAQAKNLLQSIHQNRSGFDSSPLEFDNYTQRKLPFDTQDLKDLVVRSGVITRALKEIIRKAEGLSVSPTKTPPKIRDPAFSQIFNVPDSSPCPPFRKPGLPKSKSANSYLLGGYNSSNGTIPNSTTPTALVL